MFPNYVFLSCESCSEWNNLASRYTRQSFIQGMSPVVLNPSYVLALMIGCRVLTTESSGVRSG